MAYDEDLANRVREQLSGVTVAEKKMFGGLAFLVGGNMSVAASGQGGLMVRIDPERAEELVREPGAEELEMRGRPMRGWLRVRDDVLDDATLAAWVQRGVDYARTLPKK
jgi:TfoX/Sxy family transcriptional regulator of competence genes